MDKSLFLFTMPSFIEGVARVFDIGSTMDEGNSFKSGQEADTLALYNDWKAIGIDYYSVIENLDNNPIVTGK